MGFGGTMVQNVNRVQDVIYVGIREVTQRKHIFLFRIIGKYVV